jgi:GT2 family glycosyltransferase
VAWLYHVLAFFKGKFHESSKIHSGQIAYAPHGCFIILKKKYFDMGGDFSHGVRLYGEEVHLAERLRKMNLKVILYPELRIFHREKGTEVSWLHRITLSKRTFRFKKEAAAYLASLFQSK